MAVRGATCWGVAVRGATRGLVPWKASPWEDKGAWAERERGRLILTLTGGVPGLAVVGILDALVPLRDCGRIAHGLGNALAFGGGEPGAIDGAHLGVVHDGVLLVLVIRVRAWMADWTAG